MVVAPANIDRAARADTGETESALAAEGWLDVGSWSSVPDQHYPAHAHHYEKAVVCVHGSIVFTTEEALIPLGAGDRTALDAGTVHEAVAGADGAVCVEARGRRR